MDKDPPKKGHDLYNRLDEYKKTGASDLSKKDFIVNCAETWCKVRKREYYKKCYVWVLVNKVQKVAILFCENAFRDRKVLTDFFGDTELKGIMSDGHNAYVFIGNELKLTKDTVH